jgi:hypothetical protein
MFPYLIYEAERTKSAEEQREINQINAEIVMAITGPFRSLAARLRSARRVLRARTFPAEETIPPGAVPGSGRYAGLRPWDTGHRPSWNGAPACWQDIAAIPTPWATTG